MSTLYTTTSIPTHTDLDSEQITPPARRERWLLMWAGLFITINHVTLIAAQDRFWLGLWPVGVWIACAAVGHLLLERRLPGRDPLLFPLAMFLTGWGLNLIARLVPSYAFRQTLWMVIGLAALLIITALPADLRWLRRYRYTWLIGGLALLGITILIGENPSGGGPRLWLWLGLERFYYQPSELLKVVLVAFLASYFSDHQPYMRLDTVRLGPWRVPSPAFMGPVLLMWGICVVVLVWQRDLGTAMLFFVVFLIMLYIASGQAALLAGGLVLILAAAVVAYRLFDVVALRVDIWLNPWPTAQGQAYQIVQSLLAIAEGGLFGEGIGQGQPGIIPVAHSDFVFAVIGEEWGLLGLFAALVALGTLVVRGMRVAAISRMPFRTLLAAGLSAMLGVQAVMIMGGVLKLVPLTGVTLPFVSYGGSSLLTSFVILGLLLVVSGKEKNG
ncbi:MAG: FtsW/RodA/SpoVE family cell cycle protein [Chloroflexi bacterium]|nr:FtsW/RodA/SpoVE family cell cycle protein [Chloroflexota bacterium]